MNDDEMLLVLCPLAVCVAVRLRFYGRVEALSCVLLWPRRHCRDGAVYDTMSRCRDKPSYARRWSILSESLSSAARQSLEVYHMGGHPNRNPSNTYENPN